MGQSSIDERARFSQVFEAHYPRVLAFAQRRVGRDLADEVTAETFLVAWRRLDVLPTEPLPWLYGVARNIVLRQLQAAARQTQTRESIARELILPTVEDDGDHDDLWHAWELLNSTDREVLSLTAWEELSVREVAQVLGLPAPVVSVRLHRARRRLEHHLGQISRAGVSAMKEAHHEA
jgi:RNA polymerase sigma-70 factor, ECF subfamily